MVKVFIDGEHGTTGLRIGTRLAARSDIELLSVPEADKKSPSVRKELISEANIAFLCLPDEAARESAALAKNSDTVLIDTSTAHRTDKDWAYGFPELSNEHFEAIRTGKRISVPGCHAGGFIALVYPLIKEGAVGRDYPFCCFSLTGYSGGGKSMIAEYEGESRSMLLDAPRQYGLSQKHKHLPEMQYVCSLESPPVFMPTVGDFYCGMEVSVPLVASLMKKRMSVSELSEFYSDYYGDGLIKVVSPAETGENGFLSANRLKNRDSMEILVCGNDERIVLVSRFDNLGKGASGEAIQCMNISLGLPADTGLEHD